MEEEVKNGDDLLAAKVKELKDAEVTSPVILVVVFRYDVTVFRSDGI